MGDVVAERAGRPGTPSSDRAPEGRGRPEGRRLDLLLGAAIGLRALWGLAMLPLIPLLLGTHPLLLTLLSGSTVAEVVLGAQVRIGAIAWPVAVLAGLPAWVLTDWLYWAAGGRWGDRALRRLTRPGDARARERVDRAERLAHRFGPVGVVLAPFLPVPSPLLYAAAGTAGMRLRSFVPLDLLGRLLASALVVTLGYVSGRRAVDLLETLQQYAVAATVVVVALLAVLHLLRRRAARR